MNKFESYPKELKLGGIILGLLLLACSIAFVYPFDPVMERIKAEKLRNECLSNPKKFLQIDQLLTEKEREKLCDNRNLKPWPYYWLKELTRALKNLFATGTWSFQSPKIPIQYRYFLGTDGAGLSLGVLLLESTEAFFIPGLLATLIAILGGVIIGALSGYYGGITASIGKYITILISSFPSLILVLLCTTIFGPDMKIIAAVVGITFIPHIAEEIRRKVLQLKAEEFILAAKAQGLRDSYILFYHIVWLHCTPQIFRQITFMWGSLVILETSLNYLGRGVLQKGPSWGKLLYDFRDGIFYVEWKAIAVILTVMIAMSGFYLTAKGLQKYASK